MSGIADKTRKCLVGVVQMCSTADKQQNLSFLEKQIQTAAARQAKICFIPECFALISRNSKEALESAEYLNGPTITRLSAHAKLHNIWLSLGGFQEKLQGIDDKIANTHILVDNQGQIVETYRKLHLFDIKIDAANTIAESKTYISGNKIPNVIESPAGRLGLSICYDLRFPELFRILSLQQNAQVILIPSAFFVKTGQAHWHTLLRARAIENQCYVIASAQVGQHNPNRQSYGHSLVVDPWGEVILDMGNEKVGVDFAEIDIEKLEKVRKGLPSLEHLRNDIYCLSKL